jgi:alpha-D-xyloside xylohydrolase
LTYFDNRYPQVFSFSSAAANAVDYYFIYGPGFDEIIHSYRQMTGHTPLFPRWAYGFFQSKDSYESQSELLEIAGRYRAQHIPLDCVVQDGGWWQKMGDLPFKPSYPNIESALKQLDEQHVHTMLSVWGGFKDGSVNLQHLQENGWLIPGTKQYDATNPAARDFFWQSLPGPLLAQGWDSFWLDASEPDWGPHEGDALLFDKKLAIGSGAMYTNVYPLFHTGGIAEHWKQANHQKRVVLLTRSAFLGEQRNGVMVWSGDTYPTNWSFRHQIAAGLNFAVSGMPYWTTDVAGYFPLYQGASMTTPEYQELYLRWFEFGAFCPIFRTHGHRDHNEIWTYAKVQPALETYDRLRYRMMPYLYSMAWKVTHDDYTILRPLVMDWRSDPNVADISDEYMFGPAFLVSPVWKAGARERSVYLPQASRWYDFWSGESLSGRQEINVDAPPELLPLFIRAGSIVPLGPEIEHADQKPSDPIEVRIYPGESGDFRLYDDEGDGYNYERGAHSVIPIHWDDSTGTVTLGDRIGTFPGAPDHLQFRIILVSKGHGAGGAVSKDADAVLNYSGKRIESSLRARSTP